MRQGEGSRADFAVSCTTYKDGPELLFKACGYLSSIFQHWNCSRNLKPKKSSMQCCLCKELKKRKINISASLPEEATEVSQNRCDQKRQSNRPKDACTLARDAYILPDFY